MSLAGSILLQPVRGLGSLVIWLMREVGAISLFAWQIFSQIFNRQQRGGRGQLGAQMVFAGVGSIPLVLLTAFFTGGVLALQTFHGLGAGPLSNTQVGKLVALSMLRELGPVLAGLMLASRVGAAIAAELGSMRVTEQIDALVTLAANPIKYLVIPRVLACLLMLPLLVVMANTVGIFGGWLVATHVLDIPSNSYMNATFNAISTEDLLMGLVKATCFGFLVGLMATYHGFKASNGAAGVGAATTRAVVYGAVAILISDYFITAAFV